MRSQRPRELRAGRVSRGEAGRRGQPRSTPGNRFVSRNRPSPARATRWEGREGESSGAPRQRARPRRPERSRSTRTCRKSRPSLDSPRRRHRSDSSLPRRETIGQSERRRAPAGGRRQRGALGSEYALFSRTDGIDIRPPSRKKGLCTGGLAPVLAPALIRASLLSRTPPPNPDRKTAAATPRPHLRNRLRCAPTRRSVAPAPAAS